MKKSIALVSGGIDSATLVYQLKAQGFEIYALTIGYGQRHIREIEAARNICRKLYIAHKVIDASSLQEILSSSALTNADITVPEVAEEAEKYQTLKITIVPNRNAILLSIAVAYAINIGVDYVFYGAHFSDRGIYPDCRKEFVEAFEAAERLATDKSDLVIAAPFVGMRKSEIVKLGTELRVPYEITWSCYEGGTKHCGVCSSCRERKRAFQEAGIADPTIYER